MHYMFDEMYEFDWQRIKICFYSSHTRFFFYVNAVFILLFDFFSKAFMSFSNSSYDSSNVLEDSGFLFKIDKEMIIFYFNYTCLLVSAYVQLSW